MQDLSQKLVGYRKTRTINVKASDEDSVTVSLAISLEHLTVGEAVEHGLRQIATDWSNQYRGKKAAHIRENAKPTYFAKPLRSPIRGIEDMTKEELLALITRAQQAVASK